MKYGEQLERESAPQWSLRKCNARSNASCRWDAANAMLIWASDNLDYNSLKHEIKMHTTRDQATAMVIPGYEDPALAKFENALFAELCRQHDRVDMFVSSKADEIFRRMGKLFFFHCLSFFPFSILSTSLYSFPPKTQLTWHHRTSRIQHKTVDTKIRPRTYLGQPRHEAPAPIRQVRARAPQLRRRHLRPRALLQGSSHCLSQDFKKVQGMHPCSR